MDTLEVNNCQNCSVLLKKLQLFELIKQKCGKADEIAVKLMQLSQAFEKAHKLLQSKQIKLNEARARSRELDLQLKSSLVRIVSSNAELMQCQEKLTSVQNNHCTALKEKTQLEEKLQAASDENLSLKLLKHQLEEKSLEDHQKAENDLTKSKTLLKSRRKVIRKLNLQHEALQKKHDRLLNSLLSVADEGTVSADSLRKIRRILTNLKSKDEAAKLEAELNTPSLTPDGTTSSDTGIFSGDEDPGTPFSNISLRNDLELSSDDDEFVDVSDDVEANVYFKNSHEELVSQINTSTELESPLERRASNKSSSVGVGVDSGSCFIPPEVKEATPKEPVILDATRRNINKQEISHSQIASDRLCYSKKIQLIGKKINAPRASMEDDPVSFADSSLNSLAVKANRSKVSQAHKDSNQTDLPIFEFETFDPSDDVPDMDQCVQNSECSEAPSVTKELASVSSGSKSHPYLECEDVINTSLVSSSGDAFASDNIDDADKTPVESHVQLDATSGYSLTGDCEDVAQTDDGLNRSLAPNSCALKSPTVEINENGQCSAHVPDKDLSIPLSTETTCKGLPGSKSDMSSESGIPQSLNDQSSSQILEKASVHNTTVLASCQESSFTRSSLSTTAAECKETGPVEHNDSDIPSSLDIVCDPSKPSSNVFGAMFPSEPQNGSDHVLNISSTSSAETLEPTRSFENIGNIFNSSASCKDNAKELLYSVCDTASSDTKSVGNEHCKDDVGSEDLQKGCSRASNSELNEKTSVEFPSDRTSSDNEEFTSLSNLFGKGNDGNHLEGHSDQDDLDLESMLLEWKTPTPILPFSEDSASVNDENDIMDITDGSVTHFKSMLADPTSTSIQESALKAKDNRSVETKLLQSNSVVLMTEKEPDCVVTSFPTSESHCGQSSGLESSDNLHASHSIKSCVRNEDMTRKRSRKNIRDPSSSPSKKICTESATSPLKHSNKAVGVNTETDSLVCISCSERNTESSLKKIWKETATSPMKQSNKSIGINTEIETFECTGQENPVTDVIKGASSSDIMNSCLQTEKPSSLTGATSFDSHPRSGVFSLESKLLQHVFEVCKTPLGNSSLVQNEIILNELKQAIEVVLRRNNLVSHDVSGPEQITYLPEVHVHKSFCMGNACKFAELCDRQHYELHKAAKTNGLDGKLSSKHSQNKLKRLGRDPKKLKKESILSKINKENVYCKDKTEFEEPCKEVFQLPEESMPYQCSNLVSSICSDGEPSLNETNNVQQCVDGSKTAAVIVCSDGELSLNETNNVQQCVDGSKTAAVIVCSDGEPSLNETNNVQQSVDGSKTAAVIFQDNLSEVENECESSLSVECDPMNCGTSSDQQINVAPADLPKNQMPKQNSIEEVEETESQPESRHLRDYANVGCLRRSTRARTPKKLPLYEYGLKKHKSETKTTCDTNNSSQSCHKLPSVVSHPFSKASMKILPDNKTRKKRESAPEQSSELLLESGCVSLRRSPRTKRIRLSQSQSTELPEDSPSISVKNIEPFADTNCSSPSALSEPNRNDAMSSVDDSSITCSILNGAEDVNSTSNAAALIGKVTNQGPKARTENKGKCSSGTILLPSSSSSTVLFENCNSQHSPSTLRKQSEELKSIIPGPDIQKKNSTINVCSLVQNDRSTFSNSNQNLNEKSCVIAASEEIPFTKLDRKNQHKIKDAETPASLPKIRSNKISKLEKLRTRVSRVHPLAQTLASPLLERKQNHKQVPMPSPVLHDSQDVRKQNHSEEQAKLKALALQRLRDKGAVPMNAAASGRTAQLIDMKLSTSRLKQPISISRQEKRNQKESSHPKRTFPLIKPEDRRALSQTKTENQLNQQNISENSPMELPVNTEKVNSLNLPPCQSSSETSIESEKNNTPFFLVSDNSSRIVTSERPIDYVVAKVQESQLSSCQGDELHHTETVVKGALKKFIAAPSFTSIVLQNAIDALSQKDLAHSMHVIIRDIVGSVADDYDTPLMNVATRNSHAPLLTPVQQQLVTLILQLSFQNEHFRPLPEGVLRLIEYLMFRLGKAPEGNRVIWLARLYAALCRALVLRSRALIFCWDALYAFKSRAHSIILAVLKVWPSLLPFQINFEEACPNTQVLLHILCTQVENPNQKNNDDTSAALSLKKILESSSSKHSVNSQILLSNLSSRLIDGGVNTISSAVVLLAKKESEKWAMEQVVNAHLLPALESWRKDRLNDSAAEGVIWALCSILRAVHPDSAGSLVKTSLKLLSSDLLAETNSVSSYMQEVIAIGLTLLSRHDIESVAYSLLSWKPEHASTRGLSPCLIDHLTGLVKNSARNLWWWSNARKDSGNSLEE